MLRCPKCSRSYQDGAQRFCTLDGARLLDTDNPLNQVERIPTGQLPRQTPPGELLIETFIVPPGYLSAGSAETPEENAAPPVLPDEINPANPEYISDDKYEVRHYLFDSLPESKEEKREERRETTDNAVVARKVVRNAPKSKRSKPKKTNVPFITVCLLGGLLFLTAALFTSVYLFREPKQTAVADAPQEIVLREGTPLPKTKSGFLNRRSVTFRNERGNLSGRLVEKFVGFSLTYPSDWKKEAEDGKRDENNFLDIGNRVSTRVPIEQLLVSWYESKGTFEADRETFPKLAPKLNTIYNLPAYHQLSEGAVTLNGLEAYEVRFEADAADVKGSAVKVWGRTVFIPVGKPEAKNGLLVTLLATSLAPSLSGAADVGEKGELAEILKTLKLED